MSAWPTKKWSAANSTVVASASSAAATTGSQSAVSSRVPYTTCVGQLIAGSAAAASNVASIRAVGASALTASTGQAVSADSPVSARLVCLARDEQRERAAEAEAEQPDTVVALARPVDGVAHVRPFPVPLVPVTVVETETVETACGQSVGDGPESFVPAVPAVLGVWRTRDHAGVGCSRVVVYTVQPPTNVASTRKKNVVGHTRVWDAIHRTLSPCANWVHGAVGARVKLTTSPRPAGRSEWVAN